jgi:hypothetical protein
MNYIVLENHGMTRNHRLVPIVIYQMPKMPVTKPEQVFLYLIPAVLKFIPWTQLILVILIQKQQIQK